MKLTGLAVTHKIYGSGIITEVYKKGVNTYIKVNFIREIKEFAFPGIFETAYMQFADDRTQENFKSEYAVIKTGSEKSVPQNPDDKYVKEYYSIKQLDVYASRAAYGIGQRLTESLFTYYGAAAQSIYLECCEVFGWKSYLSGNFGRQKPLFAERATPEGYDVWFICNNNYTDTNNHKWKNRISDDLEKIYEEWTNRNLSIDNGGKRVVFVKTSNGKYVFIGIYKVKKVIDLDNGSRLRVFEKVSDTYPESD